MAKIAVRVLARGDGWCVEDVVCSSGPHDRPFEEQHSGTRIGMVIAGTFQYRSRAGRDLLTPGSLLLGNAGEAFECAHDHGEGDRCISFGYAPDFLDRTFRRVRVPPVRTLTPLVAAACNGLRGANISWEELSVKVAAAAIGNDDATDQLKPSWSDEKKVTRAIRSIERSPDAPLSLRDLARDSGLSPFHFLRTFERVTGVTPHQYIVRSRLRSAAERLLRSDDKVIDIAFDCGFGDVSNFNRAFRTEFGVSPRRYREGGA